MEEVIRIGNCSGFYGDRLAAAKELIDGGPIDVLTGDYLAELTMTILYNQMQTRGENMGYVGTFLKQIKDVAKDCQEKNIKIVSNAGGLNPKSMAAEVESILSDLRLDLKVAYIDGDDIKEDIEEFQKDGEQFINIDRGIPLSESSNTIV
ncbi:MAG TPA: exopolyphosphatase, partial [Gammaproteobacteria bacterium]|nr:exopolyphosphatase [Gammaproteobacteria bacterium]